MVEREVANDEMVHFIGRASNSWRCGIPSLSSLGEQSGRNFRLLALMIAPTGTGAPKPPYRVGGFFLSTD